MRRVALSLVCWAVLVVPVEAASSLADLVRATKPAVCTVLVFSPDRAMPSVGSGSLVAPDCVLTVRHVLTGGERAEVRFPGGSRHEVNSVLADDPPWDLALLRIAPALTGVRPLPIAADLPAEGDSLVAIGCPLGLDGTVSTGVLAARRQLPGMGILLQHNVPISQGSSGGPVLNLNGEIVGVQSAMLTAGRGVVQAGQGLNFAIPSPRALALRPGPPRNLAEYGAAIPAGWRAEATVRVDACSYRPLVRDDYAGAIPFYTDQVAQRPNDADAWFHLGLCYDRTGDTGQAVKHYTRAVELRPQHSVALNNLGVLALRRNDVPAALDLFRRANAARPGYAQALSNQAVAHLRLDQAKDAVEAAQAALRADPRHAEAHLNLGLAYAKLGQRGQAEAELKWLQQNDAERAKQLERALK